MFPTADHIAAAIVAAARGLTPNHEAAGKVAIAAAQGIKDGLTGGTRPEYGGGYPLNRVRSYAALGLWDAFPDARRQRISKCTGVLANADVWGAKLDSDLTRGTLRWWSNDVESAVRAAIEAVT